VLFCAEDDRVDQDQHCKERLERRAFHHSVQLQYPHVFVLLFQLLLHHLDLGGLDIVAEGAHQLVGVVKLEPGHELLRRDLPAEVGVDVVEERA
jgi:hypothetical protein